MAVHFRFLNYFCDISKSQFLLLTGILSLLASACRTGGGSPVYDVVVVGGGPAIFMAINRKTKERNGSKTGE